MKVLIGLVGQNGAGKGTVKKILTTKLGSLSGSGVAQMNSSDPLFATLKIWGITPSRENLQRLPVAMTKAYGDGALSHAIDAGIKANSHCDFVIVDALRFLSDIPMVRKYPCSVLLYVTAPMQLRYERLRARNEKPGESTMTFGQFLVQEAAPTEIHIPEIGAGAEACILNDGDMLDLSCEVERFIVHHIAAHL